MAKREQLSFYCLRFKAFKACQRLSEGWRDGRQSIFEAAGWVAVL